MQADCKVATGFSQKANASEAILEACGRALEKAQIEKADWAFIFSSMVYSPHHESMLKLASQTLGTDVLVGGSAAGILTEMGELYHSPMVGCMVARSNRIRILPFLISDLKDRSSQLAQTILQQMPAETSAIVLFPDIFQLDAESFFKVFNDFNKNREIPIKIVGGSPSSEIPNQGTLQFCGQQVISGGVSGFYMESRDNHVQVGVSQGCQLVTKPLTVTACEGQWILELDGKPAFQVLKEHVPESLMKDLKRLIHFVFLAMPAKGSGPLSEKNFLVRNMGGVDPNSHVIAVAGKIRKGMQVAFALRNGDNAREHLKTVLKEMKAQCLQTQTRPNFGLYFNCCARGISLYGIPDIDSSYIESEFENLPLIGLSSFAEIGPLANKHYLHAYSGVLLLA